jgi:hypothetical protein
MEDGMLFKVNAQGIDAHLLVDTDAALILVTTELAEKIEDTIMSMLDPMPKRVFDAGRKTLIISGEGEFTIKVGSFFSTVNTTEAHLSVDGIIDLDIYTE